MAFALVVVLVAPVAVTGAASAATTLTVAQAIAAQNGRTATVRGYVVGQPTATSTVVRSGFPTTPPSPSPTRPPRPAPRRMLYVQIPPASGPLRACRATRRLMGQQIDVTGTLTAYFSHAGLKYPTRGLQRRCRAEHPPPTSTTPAPTGTTAVRLDLLRRRGRQDRRRR